MSVRRAPARDYRGRRNAVALRVPSGAINHEFRVAPSTVPSKVGSAPTWLESKAYATRHFQTSLLVASWQVHPPATPSRSVAPFVLTNVVSQTAWYLSPSRAMTARPPSMNSHAPTDAAQVPKVACPAWSGSGDVSSIATSAPDTLRIGTS